MVIQSYISQAELLLRNYVSADPFVVYASIVIGIVACKSVYELSQLISPIYFKSYLNLSKSRQVEWSNRAISTLHAVYITTLSMYFVFFSDLYSDDLHHGPISFRRSTMSVFSMGVSVGYFISDLGMIIWCYPSLGGMEYVVHHFLSLVGVTYAMLTGEGQLYSYMILISEATTPSINLRWYLDAAGMKKSRVYIINGVMIFLAWLVARIVLFLYLFYNVYSNYDQRFQRTTKYWILLGGAISLLIYMVHPSMLWIFGHHGICALVWQVKQMHSVGVLLVLVVPVLILIMNLMWFWKIFKGLKKTLAAKKE